MSQASNIWYCNFCTKPDFKADKQLFDVCQSCQLEILWSWFNFVTGENRNTVMGNAMQFREAEMAPKALRKPEIEPRPVVASGPERLVKTEVVVNGETKFEYVPEKIGSTAAKKPVTQESIFNLACHFAEVCRTEGLGKCYEWKDKLRDHLAESELPES